MSVFIFFHEPSLAEKFRPSAIFFSRPINESGPKLPSKCLVQNSGEISGTPNGKNNLCKESNINRYLLVINWYHMNFICVKFRGKSSPSSKYCICPAPPPCAHGFYGQQTHINIYYCSLSVILFCKHSRDNQI